MVYTVAYPKPLNILERLHNIVKQRPKPPNTAAQGSAAVHSWSNILERTHTARPSRKRDRHRSNFGNKVIEKLKKKRVWKGQKKDDVIDEHPLIVSISKNISFTNLARLSFKFRPASSFVCPQGFLIFPLVEC